MWGFFPLGIGFDCCQRSHVLGAAALVALCLVLETWKSAHRIGLQGSLGPRSVSVELPGNSGLSLFSINLFAQSVFSRFLSKSAGGLPELGGPPRTGQDEQLLGNPKLIVSTACYFRLVLVWPVAGAAITPVGSVGPNLGTAYIVSCFMGIVLGALGQSLATVLASICWPIIQSVVGSGSILNRLPQPAAGA